MTNQSVVIGSDSGHQFEITETTLSSCLKLDNVKQVQQILEAECFEFAFDDLTRFEGVSFNPKHPWFIGEKLSFDQFRESIVAALNSGRKVQVALENVYLEQETICFDPFQEEEKESTLLDLLKLELSDFPGFENLVPIEEAFALIELDLGDEIWILRDTAPKQELWRFTFKGPDESWGKSSKGDDDLPLTPARVDSPGQLYLFE